MIRKERENMISMAGTKHMVQRLLLQALPESDDDLDQDFGLISATQIHNNPNTTSSGLTSRLAGLSLTAAKAGV